MERPRVTLGEMTEEAAIALYRKSGYAVTTMQMSKRLS
jgi:hypothetical protein